MTERVLEKHNIELSNLLGVIGKLLVEEGVISLEDLIFTEATGFGDDESTRTIYLIMEMKNWGKPKVYAEVEKTYKGYRIFLNIEEEKAKRIYDLLL